MKRLLSNWTFMAFLVFVVEMVILVSMAPNMLDTYNMKNMLNNFLVVGMIALPMTLVIITGGIDLSVGSILSLSGVTMGVLWQHGVPIWLAAVIAIVIGGIAGTINGLIIVRTGIQPLIATLATMFIYAGIALVVGGRVSIAGFPSSFYVLGTGSLFDVIPVQLVIFVVLAVVFGLLLHKTTFGRKNYFLGNNENTAIYSGVDVKKVKVTIYTLSGLVAGLGGIILGSYFSSVRGDMGDGYEFLVITACLVGGVNAYGGSGTILGTVLGTFIIGMLNQGMNMMNISSVEQKIVTGFILILAVVVQQFNVYFVKRRKKVKLVDEVQAQPQ